MRLSLRFVVPLLLTVAALAYMVMPLADRLTFRWFMNDMDMRATLIANTIDEPVSTLTALEDSARIRQFFTRITQDERLYAMALCTGSTSEPVATTPLPAEINCANLDRFSAPARRVVQAPQGPLLLSVRQLGAEGAGQGRVVIVQDMSYIARRSEETKRYLFYFFVGLGVLVSIVTVVIAQLSWRGWIHGLRALMRGEGLLRPARDSESAELRPIADDLRALIRDLETEHQLRDAEQLTWTPETLRGILDRELHGQDVIIVSNREPYIHVRKGDAISVQRPASGVVTAIEPIMRACSGTWIAHGSGTADREVVDNHDRIGVPLDRPEYQLRRVWLSKEEEDGYYYGFANEGLWPLCHISHVRPVFRAEDWRQYQVVNERFADAVAEEAESADPVILIQDYHFALLPRMIRQRIPAATIITFWHIPWPNPEAFAICPWRTELLDGLLGSSILGFHTQFHCNNFIDTVDRVLEARADRETFSISYKGNATAVRRYPISVAWPPSPHLLAKPVAECRAEVRARHGLPENQLLGIGVDRLDYTKGIEERFSAVARLLELHPEWIGKFTFLQIAAPTRAKIGHYREYDARVREMAASINIKFGGELPAIVLAVEHHEPGSVFEHYRAADVCFVSSLHDGMNLVAKEFVASRDDLAGVLVLSQFTGASGELPEALIVNPYDSDQCAAALHAALTMSPSMQRARMQLMRGLVQEFNVFRWAGRMLMDAAAIRRRVRLLDNQRADHRIERRDRSRDLPAVTFDAS
ncbi:MAG: alpha,alpha-trehalose-phosphate synthase (UDP-forming) [Gemmatimonadaceae bacterium]